MKLIVITGAAGLIGSGVVRLLNDQGVFRLLLVDDLKQGEKWKNLVKKRFVDLISRHALFDFLAARGNDVEAVIHLGACSDTVETNADYLLENNYRFSIRLAEWTLSHNKRLIYASSAATYGDGSFGFSDDEALLEDFSPMNMYAFSKQLVDLWMKREGGLKKAVCLKYFNVFGPNEYHKGRMASMVLKMAHKARTEGVIRLYKSNDPQYSDGGQMRDFIYVKDAVRMTCSFLEPKYQNASGVFNIGSGIATTWNELAESLIGALDKPCRIEYVDLPPELLRQYQNYTCADMEKFFSLVPHCKMTSSRDAVFDYVRGYLLEDARW